MSFLSPVFVDLPSDIQGWINEGKSNTEANHIFKKGYEKYLVNRALECLAYDIQGDETALETLLENIKDKVDELDPKKANKFCLKIAKLVKEEVASQLKADIKQLTEKREVKSLEEFVKE